MSDVRARWIRIVAIGAAIITVGVVVWQWIAIASTWTAPYVDYDTQIFQQIADQPVGFELLVQAKPLFVPLIHRLAGNDPSTVVTVQAVMSVVAWTVFAISLVLATRRLWVRVVAVMVCVSFVLAPVRMGFTSSLLSESIDDSMLVLVLACAIHLLRVTTVRARRIVVGISLVVGVLWLVTRDTNVPVAIVAAVSAILVWGRHRDKRAWLVVAGVVAAAGFASWTATRPHALLAYQDNWYERFSPRTLYPVVDNVTMRVFPDDPDALPAEVTTGLEAFTFNGRLFIDGILRGGHEHREMQDWLVDHGLSTYASWWLRHPFTRLGEIVDNRWTILASTHSKYMPAGWTLHSGFLRHLTLKHEILLALLFASPLLLWRPSAHLLRSLALCMVTSGLAGVVVAYYGDAAEVPRHCYGPGQQVVLALFIALIAWLDVVDIPARLRDRFRRA